MAEVQTNSHVASVITWIAALVSLVLRVVARRITKQPWWVDDYFCISAFVFASAFSILILIWSARYSFGATIDPSLGEVEREQLIENARLLMFCCEFCYAFSIASTKVAILALYWRLFKLSGIRRAIQVMFVICVMWIILRTFMVTFQCTPTEYFWNKSIHGRCTINEAQFFFATILTHCIMDVAILILPIIEVSKLQLRMGQKLAVIGLFLIGAIVCLASIFTIVESIKYDPKTTEMPRDIAISFVWGDVEMNIAIVSACFPLLRPVFQRFLPHSFLGSHDSSHQLSRTTQSRAINMSRITRHKHKDGDETSSTHQLADPEPGLAGRSDYDQGPESIQTVISSRLHSSHGHSDSSHEVGKIYVRNEMVVEVGKTDDPYRVGR